MLVLALLAVLFVAPATSPPAPTRWVEDQVGLLSPATRTSLDGTLEGYQRATGHQVVVWIGDSLGDTPLDDWAVRTFAAWKVGRQGLDDGVVMFILVGDRAIDIEVGYGLEGAVPDATAARIIALMAPQMRADDADGAVTAGVQALLTAIEGRPWAGAPQPARAPPQRGATTLEWILGALAILGFLILAVTHPRFAMMLLWTIASGGRGGGGGGGGGFSGGGGRSGGGGARGSW